MIIEVWRRLAALRRLSFVCRPGPQSQSGWAGRGEATIELEPVDSIAGLPTLRVFERGQFVQADNGCTLQFSNVYRWQRADNQLWLFHERFGSHRPVFLLALVPAGPEALASREPHLCAADRYHARLALGDDGFRLDWRITGPGKDESLAYHYACRRDDSAMTAT